MPDHFSFLIRSRVRVGCALAVWFCSIALAATDSSLPQLRPKGSAVELVVDGQPFLIRGGELGNSSASNLKYLAPFWSKFTAMHLNTILAPVYWDLIEPKEGSFDFSLVDGLIRQARENRMRLVLLWFGSWKNSMSCYAPAWVKSDLSRFPRAQDRLGHDIEILSPFHNGNAEVDARAFAALMQHLRETDGREHTVIMVQVENEIGMIPTARDHSAAATAQFQQPVPTELMQRLQTARERGSLTSELRDRWASAGGKTAGTWTEIFGDGPATDELFMAWYFARYTDVVAAKGKAEYALPMFANAALIRPAYQPGQYPSAGPLPHLMDVWRAGAPHLDFLSPDIYFPNFAEWTGKYARLGNPLFVPEALRSPDAAVNALYAFGAHGAIGFAPFAIESVREPAASLLAGSFDLIAQLTPLLAERLGTGTTAGLRPPADEQRQPHELRLGGYVLSVVYERVRQSSLADGIPAAEMRESTNVPAGGLVIALGADEFLFAGTGVTVTFAPIESGKQAGILSAEEGRFVDGVWQNVLWLGGDQTHQGRHLRLESGRFSIQRIKLYRYP
ncbi:MAG: DUF5597 domain-containing protein [Opitutus sp.]